MSIAHLQSGHVVFPSYHPPLAKLSRSDFCLKLAHAKTALRERGVALLDPEQFTMRNAASEFITHQSTHMIHVKSLIRSLFASAIGDTVCHIQKKKFCSKRKSATAETNTCQCQNQKPKKSRKHRSRRNRQNTKQSKTPNQTNSSSLLSNPPMQDVSHTQWKSISLAMNT